METRSRSVSSARSVSDARSARKSHCASKSRSPSKSGINSGSNSSGSSSSGSSSDSHCSGTVSEIILDEGRPYEAETDDINKQRPFEVVGQNADSTTVHRVYLRYRAVARLSNTMAQASVKCNVQTALKYPCENRRCRKLIGIRKWARLVNGSLSCVHCGHRRGHARGAAAAGSVITAFTGKKYLNKYLNSAKCRTKRSLTVDARKRTDIIGKTLLHQINDPVNKIVELGEGDSKPFFKCPKCDIKVVYRARYSHVILCYPKNAVNMPAHRRG